MQYNLQAAQLLATLLPLQRQHQQQAAAMGAVPETLEAGAELQQPKWVTAVMDYYVGELWGGVEHSLVEWCLYQ